MEEFRDAKAWYVLRLHKALSNKHKTTLNHRKAPSLTNLVTNLITVLLELQLNILDLLAHTGFGYLIYC